MTPEIQTAINVLFIGMISVVVILSLVIATARVVIAVTNRFAEPVGVHIKGKKVRARKKASLPDEHVAIVAAVVASLTAGKGNVISIQKQN